MRLVYFKYSCCGLVPILLVLALSSVRLQAAPDDLPSNQGTPLKSYRDLGLEFYHAEDWGNAVSNFNKAIHFHPQDAWAYNCRAVAREYQGDLNGAMADFKMALRISPDYANIYVNCGELFQYKKHELGIAIADYTEAIRLDPTNADTFVTRARAYMAETNFDQALNDFGTAILMQPANPGRLISRGDAYQEHQEFEKALNDFNMAVQLGPTNDWNFFRRARFQSEMTNYAAAASDYHEAIRLNPTNTYYWSTLGNFHSDITNYDAALADFTQCIRLDPTNDEYYSCRARVEDKAAKAQGRLGSQKKQHEYLDRVREDWQEAATLNPHCLSQLGKWKCCQGQYEAGIADFTKLLEAFPINTTNYDYNCLNLRAFAWERAAMEYAKRGERAKQTAALDHALADLNQLVSMNAGGNNVFISYRGDFYARNKQYAKALTEYHQAIELQPTNRFDAFSSLASFLATCPDPAFRDGTNALVFALKALERRNHSTGDFCLIDLAAAYAETGNFAEAVKSQKAALEMSQDRSDAARAELQNRLELYEQGKPCHKLFGVLLFD